MRKLIVYFIKYPVAVNVLLIGTFLFGFMGLKSLKSSFFPLTDASIITVSINYPGASPQEMEEGVVLKIEDNIRGLVGIDRFTSSSLENYAIITIEKLKDADIDVLLAEVKNAVDKVPSFPAGMEPPVVTKIENLTQAISFVVTGRNASLKALKQIGREVENDIRNIEGISQVELSGFPDEEIEIAVDEEKLRAYNLSFNDISNAVAANNLLLTGGSVKTASEDYLIRVNTRAYHGHALDDIIVKADASGKIVRLRDIAIVRDAWSEIPDRSYFNGQPSVKIDVQTTNNEDLVETANKVLAYIETFNSSHEEVKLEVTRNSSITIIQRTNLLLKNGSQGIALVLIFLSLFLKPRLAAWVAFGIPVSFMGMFMLSSFFEVTINVLSLFGMIIVIGILVDDGIVIAENIYHHYEKGKNRIQAAIDGTMEVLTPIVSAIITTIIAFATFFFIEGRIGDFFSEVSIIVFLTLAFSLVEALIILPSHIAHSRALLPAQKTYVFNRVADNFMRRLRDKIYMPVLNFVLRNRFFAFSIILSVFILTIAAFRGGIIKRTFFPVIASDVIQINLKMPQGVNPQVTDSLITHIEKVAWEVNEDFTSRQSDGQSVFLNIIRNLGPGTAEASLIINLLPGEERDFASFEIAEEINKRSGNFPLAESVVFDSGSSFGGKPVSVSLLSNNITELKAAKQELKNELAGISALRDLSDNDPAGIKEIKLSLRDGAYLLGLNLNDVLSQVRGGFYGLQIQRYQRRQDEIILWVRYDREGRSSLKDLEEMRIVTPTGDRVPLKEIADYYIERGEISINHLDGKREIKVEADLRNPKEGATDVLEQIRNDIMPKITSKYRTVSALYEGQNRTAARTGSSAGKILPVILLLIYITIAFTFRSYSQPLLLLLMVPFCLIGVGWGHWIHGFPVNMLSLLGIIALIGIMVNDGLVFIGKYNGFLREGKTISQALLEAGKSRFRAIFLTSLTTIAGLSPLIFETSRQAQFLIPMAISIAYGIGFATILTLLVLPMMISVTNTAKVYLRWLWTGKKPENEELESAIRELKSENDENF